MKKQMLVDTDVLVDLLRGRPRAVSFIGEHQERIVLSAIGVAELYAGVKGEDEMADVDDFIGLFPVLPVTREIARQAGLLKRMYHPSHSTGLADAVVAATAAAHGLTLQTLNVKHFPMLKGLRPAYRKD